MSAQTIARLPGCPYRLFSLTLRVSTVCPSCLLLVASCSCTLLEKLVLYVFDGILMAAGYKLSFFKT